MDKYNFNYKLDTISYDELKKINKWYEKKYGPYVGERGMQNWKNLFRKPVMLEWIIFAMILLGLLMGYAYHLDIKSCQEVIQNPCAYCQFSFQDDSGIINPEDFPSQEEFFNSINEVDSYGGS